MSNSRNFILGTAALALVAFQSPAIAGDFDPTIDFGSSLKSEFIAEDNGATYGDKHSGFVGPTQYDTRAFDTTDTAGSYGYGASNKVPADFNTPRDWR